MHHNSMVLEGNVIALPQMIDIFIAQTRNKIGEDLDLPGSSETFSSRQRSFAIAQYSCVVGETKTAWLIEQCVEMI